MEERNRQKGDMLYKVVDSSDGYFRCPVEKESRSYMNAVFRLPNEELEAKFVTEAGAPQKPRPHLPQHAGQVLMATEANREIRFGSSQPAEGLPPFL